MTDTVASELLSPREVAELLNVSVATVRRWRQAGILTPAVDSSRPRYRREDLFAIRRPRIGNPDWREAGWRADETERAAQLRQAGASIAAIAAQLGRSDSGVKNKLSRLGVQVRTQVRWSDVEDAELEQLIRDGYAIADIARRLKRSPRSIAHRLARRDRSVRTERTRGAVIVRSLEEVACLFGVHHSVVRRWLRRGWLRRAGDARRVTTRTRRVTLIHDVDIVDFLGVAAAWPSYDPARIGDPDLRAIAYEARNVVRDGA